MADLLDQINIGNTVAYRRYKDMGDGTHAEVVAVAGSTSGVADLLDEIHVEKTVTHQRYKDMGDGSHAEVVSVASG